MKSIEQIVREWRGDKTQLVAAKMLGIPQGALSRIEQGKKVPSKREALSLSKATGYPLEAFIRSDKAS
jgi:transcriptional regulator with XRE-family HTH domain